jgi:hypothetical protein
MASRANVLQTPATAAMRSRHHRQRPGALNLASDHGNDRVLALRELVDELGRHRRGAGESAGATSACASP